jgi:regulator of cell morphogenesis and NO signaling
MINKNKIISKDMKMFDVILNNHLMITVLERFGINLGFNEKTIEFLCHANKISTKVFLFISNLYNDLECITHIDFNYKDTQSIIQYLKNSHKYYLEEKYPEIINNILLMYNINKTSETMMVDKFFKEYTKEVMEHMNYENDIVFPYINNLFDKIKGKNNKYENNNYSVIDYKKHHNDIEEKLTDIKNLLIKYLPQKNDRIIRRKILFDLFELEYDLSIHQQIENNILIPIVKKMELEIKK